MAIIISATETPISSADITISAFDMSFFGAEISISAAKKTAGAVQACLFPQ